MRDIGKNIKQLRQVKNMTQDELAEKLFVTRQTVSNYETGKSRPDVEMLTQIAAALETDANTILYGIPEQPEKKRMVIKLCIGVAAMIILFVGYLHIETLARELKNTYYDMRLWYLCRDVAGPALVFLFTWTALQALQVFAKLSPLRDPWAKRLRWTVIIAIPVYVILLLPLFSICFFGFDFSSALPDFMGVAWCYTGYWLMGYLPKMYIRPNIVLFGILGCMLWLGMPEKTRE